MTEFTFGSYHVEVDVEATRAWYAAQTGPGITCDCAGCRNFVQALPQFPPEVRAFFEMLGIDPARPGELCYYHGTPQSLSGGGWYHLAGRTSHIVGEGLEPYALAEGFSVYFQKECWLLPPDFPKPAIQMEFGHLLPWLLEEENPYL